jgi:two-component system alkaline phosphatase synthesis response regulator PhoP
MNKPTRILVVDDDPIVRTMLHELLGRAAYNVQVAADAQQALQLIYSTPPDLVLLDIQLPDLDGLDVLRRLRETPETRTLPVVLLTGSVLDQDRLIETLQLDPDEILTKNISAKELVARIEWVLRRYR